MKPSESPQLLNLQNRPKVDDSVLVFLCENMLDYKTLLLEHLFPLVRSSLSRQVNLISLLGSSAGNSFSISQQNLKMVNDALPLCKRFLAQLDSNQLLRQLFVKVAEELRANNTETAQFFADKLVTLTDHAALAVFLLGEVLFRAGEYTKVNYLFHKNNLLLVDENFLDLTARSLLKLKKYDQCLKIINNAPKIELYNREGRLTAAFSKTHDHFQSSKFRLMGVCYKNLDNRSEAELNLLKSLKVDSSQVPVFMEYLSVREANLEDLSKVIDSLHFQPQHAWLREFYCLCNTKHALDTFAKLEVGRASKSGHPARPSQMEPFKENQPNVPDALVGNRESMAIQEETQAKVARADPTLCQLVQQSNTQLLYLKAKALYQNYELQEAYKVCKKILTLDSFHFPTLDIYTELLVERKVD